MKYLIASVWFLLFGCASVSQKQILRQPNEVAPTLDSGDEALSSQTLLITLPSRFELPKGSQMRPSDVVRAKYDCEITLDPGANKVEILIKLNADVSYRGSYLAGTNQFEIETEVPLRPPDYTDGQYAVTMFGPRKAEQRYIVFTDPYFKTVTKVVYEVYFGGKKHLSYLCESNFTGV